MTSNSKNAKQTGGQKDGLKRLMDKQRDMFELNDDYLVLKG